MKIELFSRKSLLGKRKWFFRLRAANGEIIAQSEGYSRRIDALDTAHHIKEAAGAAAVTDAR